MRGFGNLSSKFYLILPVILVAILFLHMPSQAGRQETKVVTYNLYLGAEIQSLAGIEDPTDFVLGVKDALDQIAANDFSERAVALASVIVEKDPQLIGLQEVYKFTSSLPYLNDSPPFLDYLEELQFALAEQGACYEVVATVENFDLRETPIPVPTYGAVTILDRDVILARCDVDAEPVVLQNTSDCRTSLDGCNYSYFAFALTPVGVIAFERGFVAVDTIFGRFFNTHLEVRNPDPSNPASPMIQRLQAQQLINAINEINSDDPPSGPVIVVGDINSSPVDPYDPLELPLQPPYMQFGTAGYIDTWTLRPGKPKGFTCCFGEDLSVPADLYERIDVVFSDEPPYRVKANVLGNDEADQTDSGLWPSDHAGVAARIEF
jgi:hypothetical protein